MKPKNKKYLSLGLAVLIGTLFLGFVLATAPTWKGTTVNYTTSEDSIYYHNLSKNITGFNNDVNFSIDTEGTIYWTNATGRFQTTKEDISGWIKIYNADKGNLTINASNDAQTGFFEIPIQATNTTGQPAATVETLEFIINATNDAPNFTSIEEIYNLTQNQLFLEYLNATDEEEHYPLYFNISFFTNCTHADWSGRGAGENCSILNLTNIANTSASMTLTPLRNDVGTYWANISVMDSGESYSCPHDYCDSNSYEQNKTTYYSEVIKFNVFASLEINVSDCQNKIFQENESGACQINITTKEENDLLNISSTAFLRNYDASVSNSRWFYPDNSTNSSNFLTTVFINITPQKTEIGNWTINFTVQDLTSGENSTEQIYIYVNRTSNDSPELADIEDMNLSIDLEKTIDLTVYDDDLLILDKNTTFGGYDETITFEIVILNQSNLDQELNINGFDVEVLNMPVAGTNRTEARIQFTPNSSEIGNYTINVTINDLENSFDSKLFNLSIVSNQFPVWNQTSYSFDLVVNSSLATTASFGPINLTDGYVTDAGDTLTFANNSGAFPEFNLTSEGIISFTPYKEDVGNWSFNVIATDSLGLQNTTTFIFNITNTNSAPVIQTPLSGNNVTIDANSNINAIEDNYTVITLWVNDDDFKISSAKKIYYNESLSINLTIEGPNSSLFNFIKTDDFPAANHPNRTEYEAIFTPDFADVGSYNITINVTDSSNSSDILEFNLTINATNDAPVLTEVANQTSSVNRTFYYDFNATDEEDGEDSQGNLTFNITFLQGLDFINNNETIFNTSSGILNITFNESHTGIYRINITVNDTGGSEDSDEFWLYVYGVPEVILPVSGENFSLQENTTANLTFQVNHTIGDNLTYEFYIDDVLRNTTTYYGNSTNLTWQFTPNFTDETYGRYKNLTLIVYPANSELENRTELNTTANYNINISHTNSPVSFSGYIGDKQASYNNDIEIDLSQYFSDIDYSDEHYNQTVDFNIASNSNPSSISSSVSNWILTLSSSVAVTELLNITGNDSSTNVTSNSFEVEFTTPTTVTVPTPSGGSSKTVPVSLKIIIPDPVSAYKGDRIVLPITLHNSGEKILKEIILTSRVIKNNSVIDSINVSLDKTYFSSLAIGEKQNTTLIAEVNTEELGTFEITINASVKDPKYNDWGKIYLTVKEGNNIEDRILFTEEFLGENPECVELEEVLNEAREFFKKGDFVNTVLKINEAIEGCKNAISQQARAKRKEKEENKLYQYLLIITLIVFFLGIVYYSYKRMRLKRSYKKDLLGENKNIAMLILAITGVIGLFAVTNIKMTGFAVNSYSISNNKFGLGFTFIIAVLGVLVFFKKRRVKMFVEFIKHKIVKKASPNSVGNLIEKKVYTDSGDYIGKIKEVVLGKNKISGLRIKLDKRKKENKKIKVKGIIMPYKKVKSVGEIIIIERNIYKIRSIKYNGGGDGNSRNK
jgi:sporulation protein YlmC with PRC-barrel domain